MESMEKVQELERELEELKLKVSSLEAGLKSAEMRIESLSSAATVAKESPTAATNSNHATYSATYTQNVAAYGQNRAATNTQSGAYSYAQNAAATNTQGRAYSYAQNAAPSRMQPVNKASTESWIGKILMGALASLLVFIALITFAKLLLPFINDGIKIALMFIASIALTATGFVLSKKKPSNTFFKALLACGTACIYLSILVTGIHFKAISSIVMYVLIAVWAVVMIFLKESKNDWLFFSIGNIGYFVSILFTEGLKDESLVIPMLVYAVMVCSIYQIMYWKNDLQREVQSIINIVSLVLFQLIVSFIFKKTTSTLIVGFVAVAWGLLSLIAYNVADLFHYRKNHFYVAAANTLAYIVAFFTLDMILELPLIVSFVVLVIPAIVFEVINAYWRSVGAAKSESILSAAFSVILFYSAALIISWDKNIIFKSGIILILYSLMTAFGIIKKDSFFKIQGWILVVLCASLGFQSETGLFFTFVATALTVSALVVEGFIINESAALKALSYIFLFACILKIDSQIVNLPELLVDDAIIHFITFAVMALISLTSAITGFYRTKENRGGQYVHITMDVINLILILAGAYLMYTSDSIMLMIFYMAISFALACVNLPVKGRGDHGRYLYAGIKIGALLFLSLKSFYAPSFVISICMIAFAVLCIALGFRNRLLAKELRIFGLIMTLLFVIKFIVIDISFDSSVLKALSYLIAGILCFGISAIYNHFEKSTAPQNPQQPPQQGNQFQQ